MRIRERCEWVSHSHRVGPFGWGLGGREGREEGTGSTERGRGQGSSCCEWPSGGDVLGCAKTLRVFDGWDVRQIYGKCGFQRDEAPEGWEGICTSTVRD